MLITELITPDLLGVKCNYSLDYVARFRQLPATTFDRNSKLWLVPVGAFDEFESLFRGEIVYKTPRWVITGEKPPDLSKMYAINPNIICPDLKIPPFDYQKFGIRMMVDRIQGKGFVINADDVGLGKTLQAIGTIKYMIDNHGLERIIIACKKSLKRQWVAEIKKFSDIADNMFVTISEGTPKQRAKIYAEFEKHGGGIIVANYQTLLGDKALLEAMNFDMLIADEVHYIKSRTGQMNNATKDIVKNAKYKVFLTGTPIMSKPDDIFGIIQIAKPGYFGPWKKFEDKHIRNEWNGRFQKTVGYMALDELRNMVQDVVIRRTEHEVEVELPDMPPPIRIDCELDKVQTEIIEAIRVEREDLQTRLEGIKLKNSKDEATAKRIVMLEGSIKGLIAASQAVANDPRLFYLSKSQKMKEKYSVFIPASYKMSSKTEALLDIVEDIITNGEKVIIFSKFERSTRLLQHDLKKALKCDAVIYSGAADDEQRELAIQTFLNDSDCNVLLGTDAMSEGLNLQKAKYCIHYDQPDTPAIKTQRAGRIRRVGSVHKLVFVYDLITENSKDVERLENIIRAQGLFDGLVSVDAAQSEAIKKAIAKEQ